MMNYEQRKSELEDVLTKIGQLEEGEIGEAAQAVIRRYGKLFPDWEVIYFALPRGNAEQRRKNLQALTEFLRNHG